MNRFEQAAAVESIMDEGQGPPESHAFVEARLSSPPGAKTGDMNSSSMPSGFSPAPELMADLQGTGVIKLPRGPVDEGATFHERVAKPGNGGGSSGTYDDTDANAYRSLEASADIPKPPVRTPSPAEMQRELERGQRKPGESFREWTERLTGNA